MRAPSSRQLLARALIVPVVFLISFLALGSQALFSLAPAHQLPPGPLSFHDTVVLNIFFVVILITYYRACATHPGKFDFAARTGADLTDAALVAALRARYPATRWCAQCRTPKAPRAHHCSVCRRCVPRMDHHCPWLGNCVGMATLPHFVRFLAWATAGLWLLSMHLYDRISALFAMASMPAYLGPRPRHMVALLSLCVVCAFTTLFLTIMLGSTLWDCVRNQTTVEAKEIKTYEDVLDRRSRSAWWSDARRDEDSSSGGDKNTPTDPLEFPYEIGFFKNMAQAMNSSNPLVWIWPFASTPAIDPDGFGSGEGWRWEENGFNGREGMWPPREVRRARKGRPSHHNHHHHAQNTSGKHWPGAVNSPRSRQTTWTSAEQEKEAFRARQVVDHARREALRRARQQVDIMRELEEDEDADGEEDVPLSQLAGRRKVA